MEYKSTILCKNNGVVNSLDISDYDLSQTLVVINDSKFKIDSVIVNKYNHTRILYNMDRYILKMLKCINSKEYLNDFVPRLKNIDSIEKLDQLFMESLKIYATTKPENTRDEKMQYQILEKIPKLYSKNHDLGAFIFIKYLLYMYVDEKILSCDKDTLDMLTTVVENNDEVSLIELTGEEIPKICKENGICNLLIKIYKSTFNKLKYFDKEHLCYMSCKNADVCNCAKVRDVKKQMIGSYDFITDGVQLYDNKGKLAKFIVTECSNYVEGVSDDIDLDDDELIKSKRILL